MKKLRKVGMALAICVTTSTLFNSVTSFAKQHYKVSKFNDSLRIWSINGDNKNPFVIGVNATVVDVFSSAREYYTTSGSNATYNSRSMYVTFKKITSSHKPIYMVTPISHGSNRFGDWENKDFLAGNVDYVYCKESNTRKTYKKTTGVQAKWSVGIFTEDTCDVPVASARHEMSLNIYCGSGK